MSSSGVTGSLNIFISRCRGWEELATNHRATINEPLSLPVKLINCLFPTVLFLTWGNTMAASASQRLKNTEVHQRHGRTWKCNQETCAS